MRELTHLSLFSGIGGLDLAAEWAGFKTVGQCEYADYPTKVLEKHWPTVERWRDIRTLTGESFYERTGLRTVDLISGGFPCQPFSVAGKQRGKEDDRYLWPEMVRVIKELRPTWIVGENVAGIVKLALPDILSELEAEGYRTRTFLIPACAVGARHRRYRVAIVAYSDSSRQDRTIQPMGGQGTPEQESERSGSYVSDTHNTKTSRFGKYSRKVYARAEAERPCISSSSYGAAQSRLGRMADGIPLWLDGYWDVEPDIPRIAKGIPNRVERLKGLGNAVVPQQFYPVLKAIADVERSRDAGNILQTIDTEFKGGHKCIY